MPVTLPRSAPPGPTPTNVVQAPQSSVTAMLTVVDALTFGRVTVNAKVLVCGLGVYTNGVGTTSIREGSGGSESQAGEPVT